MVNAKLEWETKKTILANVDIVLSVVVVWQSARPSTLHEFSLDGTGT